MCTQPLAACPRLQMSGRNLSSLFTNHSLGIQAGQQVRSCCCRPFPFYQLLLLLPLPTPLLLLLRHRALRTDMRFRCRTKQLAF